MTAPELAAIVHGLAPAVRALVERELTKAIGDVQPRMAALDERVCTLEQTDPLPARGERGEPGPPGQDGVTAIRYVVPWQDGFEYQPGDLVAIGPAVYCCEKATTVKPGTVSRNAHGDVRGPQGKDFWAQLYPAGRA